VIPAVHALLKGGADPELLANGGTGNTPVQICKSREIKTMLETVPLLPVPAAEALPTRC